MSVGAGYTGHLVVEASVPWWPALGDIRLHPVAQPSTPANRCGSTASSKERYFWSALTAEAVGLTTSIPPASISPHTQQRPSVGLSRLGRNAFLLHAMWVVCEADQTPTDGAATRADHKELGVVVRNPFSGTPVRMRVLQLPTPASTSSQRVEQRCPPSPLNDDDAEHSVRDDAAYQMCPHCRMTEWRCVDGEFIEEKFIEGSSAPPRTHSGEESRLHRSDGAPGRTVLPCLAELAKHDQIRVVPLQPSPLHRPTASRDVATGLPSLAGVALLQPEAVEAITSLFLAWERAFLVALSNDVRRRCGRELEEEGATSVPAFSRSPSLLTAMVQGPDGAGHHEIVSSLFHSLFTTSSSSSVWSSSTTVRPFPLPTPFTSHVATTTAVESEFGGLWVVEQRELNLCALLALEEEEALRVVEQVFHVPLVSPLATGRAVAAATDETYAPSRAFGDDNPAQPLEALSSSCSTSPPSLYCLPLLWVTLSNVELLHYTENSISAVVCAALLHQLDRLAARPLFSPKGSSSTASAKETVAWDFTGVPVVLWSTSTSLSSDPLSAVRSAGGGMRHLSIALLARLQRGRGAASLSAAFRSPMARSGLLTVGLPDVAAQQRFAEWRRQHVGGAVSHHTEFQRYFQRLQDDPSQSHAGFSVSDWVYRFDDVQRQIVRRVGQPTSTACASPIPPASVSSLSLTPSEPRRTAPFGAFFGMDDVLDRLSHQVLWPITHLAVLRRYRVPCLKGALLCGGTGTGKTALLAAVARYLRHLPSRPPPPPVMGGAVALVGDDCSPSEGGHTSTAAVTLPAANEKEGCNRVHVMTADGLALLEKEVGRTEQNIAALFQEARARAPTVLVFDNLDAIAPPRSAGGGSESNHGASDRMLSTLLVELDGLGATGGGGTAGKEGRPLAAFDGGVPLVVLVASAPSLEALDPAVYRPGRLDVHVVLQPPSLQGSRVAMQQRIEAVLRDTFLRHCSGGASLSEGGAADGGTTTPSTWLAVVAHLKALIEQRLPDSLGRGSGGSGSVSRVEDSDVTPLISGEAGAAPRALPSFFSTTVPPSLLPENPASFTAPLPSTRTPTAACVLADIREVTLQLLRAFHERVESSEAQNESEEPPSEGCPAALDALDTAFQSLPHRNNHRVETVKG